MLTEGHGLRTSKREATTEAMLDAAEKLFAERGFAAVSVREIAAETGVSHALVHRYLGSKDDILSAVFARHAGEMGAAAADADNVSDAMVLMLREGLAHHRAYLRVIIQTALQDPPFAELMRRMPVGARLASMAEEAAARFAGREGGVPPRFVIAAVLALSSGWVATDDWLRRAMGLDDVAEEAIVDQLEDVVRGIIARHLHVDPRPSGRSLGAPLAARRASADARARDAEPESAQIAAGPSRGAKGAATTGAMLDAAEKLFSERGVAAASVREIAAEAGVSHALVHRYLGSKSDVHRAVFKRRQETIRQAAEGTSDLPDAMAIMLREGLAHHRRYLRLVLQASLHGLSFEETMGGMPAASQLAAMAESVAGADARETPRPVTPRFTIAAVVALYLGWAGCEDWLPQALGLDDVDEATRVNHLEDVLRGVIASNVLGDRD